jgi:hypothetical protein
MRKLKLMKAIAKEEK